MEHVFEQGLVLDECLRRSQNCLSALYTPYYYRGGVVGRCPPNTCRVGLSWCISVNRSDAVKQDTNHMTHFAL